MTDPIKKEHCCCKEKSEVVQKHCEETKECDHKEDCHCEGKGPCH